MEKTMFSFRMSEDLKVALQKLADTDRRSLSSYVHLALEDHVAAKKKGGKRK